MNHGNSALAESLLVPKPVSQGSRQSPIPSRIKNYLTGSKCSSVQAKSLAQSCEDQALTFLALGFDPDLHWDQLPRDIRELVIKRCTGQDDGLTRSQNEWLVFNQAKGIPIKTFLTRCNFGAFVAMSCRRYALGTRDETTDEKLYRLDIYGAIDKALSYSTDCFEIIASKALPRFVVLRGEANPTDVLAKTWVFLNSSISEGLPLALGEAALTGAPVVCTDVGASLRVLTDPDTAARYSAVVAPNDARNLARAQINFLAMLDKWTPYANDPEGFVAPTISGKPIAEDVAIITQRMYAKTKERKALGMRSREIVQKSFGGERYLREHEQML